MKLASLLGVLTLVWGLDVFACPSGSQLRVMSYNIHRSAWMEFSKYWSSRRAAVLNSISENPADLYAFQEMTPEQQAEVATLLPGFTAVRQSRHLVLFYRSLDWKLIHSSRWRDSDSMEAGRTVLQLKTSPMLPFIDIWNIWLNEALMDQENESFWSLAEILRSTSSAPSLVSLSMRARDELLHDRRLYADLLQSLSLKQAAPDIYRITTNGWWAEKKITADWHDAVFAREDWTLESAQNIKVLRDGSFPSTHYPLLTTYCPPALSDDLMAGASH